MQKKNILIFGHGFATQFIDISNQYTRLFDEHKYHVTVVYLSGAPSPEARARHLAPEVIFLNATGAETRGLKISVIKKMLTLQRQKQFEIVFCHRYKPLYTMLWINKFIKIPLIFGIMHELKTMRHLTRRILLTFLWGKNVILAGVSNAVRDDLRASLTRIPEDHIITLYNMIDVPATTAGFLPAETARQALGFKQDDFLFGTIGRLVPAKDQATLIQAFAAIKSRCPKAKLIIIGDGELQDALAQQINQCGLTNDIILTGFKDLAFQYMKAFDVFILCSIKEAFGRVLLEAMLATRPIIATRVNGIPEVLGPTNRLIDPQNVSQLSAAMQAFYQMPATELQHLGLAGETRAHQDFSLDYFKQSFWQLPFLTEPQD